MASKIGLIPPFGQQCPSWPLFRHLEQQAQQQKLVNCKTLVTSILQMLTIALLRRWLWVRAPPNPNFVSNPSFPSKTANKAVWQAIKAIQIVGEIGIEEWGQKRQNGHENLEKEQQRATYWTRWKHTGMSQENATGYGYP
jgi:hypothetical protein